MKETRKSVSGMVSEKIESSPFLLKALEMGFANVSAVSRQLAEEFKAEGKKAGFEAVRAAVKRLASERRAGSKKQGDRITRLLRKSKLELSTKVSVLVLELTRQNEAAVASFWGDTMAAVKSENCLTVVLPEEFLANFKKKISESAVLIENRGLVALTLVTPVNIEDTPGVVAFIAGRLAENGINIKEFLSSYTDTTMLLEKKDAVKAYEVLEKTLA